MSRVPCLHEYLANAARVRYPAALLRCKLDAPSACCGVFDFLFRFGRALLIDHFMESHDVIKEKGGHIKYPAPNDLFHRNGRIVVNLSVDFLHLFDNRLPIHAFFQDPDYRNSGIFIYVFHQNAACLRTLWREVLRFLPKHPYPTLWYHHE